MMNNRRNAFSILLLLALIGCSSVRNGSGAPNGANGETNRPAGELSAQDRRDFERLLLSAAATAMAGDHEEAILTYHAALGYRPAHPAALEGLARSLLALRRIDSAVDVATEAVRANPRDVETRRLLADLLLIAGRGEHAAAEYQAILLRNPKDLQARTQAAEALEKTDPSLAQAHYEYIRDHIVDDFGVLLSLYELYVRKGDRISAAQTVSLLLRQEPDDADLHAMYAKEWLGGRRYDSAAAAVARADDALEENAAFERVALELLADAEYELIRNRDQGLRRFADTLLTHIAYRFNESEVLIFEAGLLALRIGRDTLADSLLVRSVGSDEVSSARWGEVAEIYLERGAPERLLRVLEPVAARYANEPDVSFQLAVAYHRIGNIDSARTMLERVVATDPGNAEAWRQLARIRREARQWSAMQAYEQAVFADPFDPELLGEYADYLAEFKVNLARGRELAELALDIEPENEQFLTTAGLIEHRLGNDTLALDYLRRAVAAGGASSERLELMGDVQASLGDRQGARRSFEQALRVTGLDGGRERKLREKIARLNKNESE